jgi:hypothetical protein
MHRMGAAPWNGDKIPLAHNSRFSAQAELDLAFDEVEEMMAVRMRVTFDAVCQAIDPDVHLRRLRQRGKLKAIRGLNGLQTIELHNGEGQLTRKATHWEK